MQRDRGRQMLLDRSGEWGGGRRGGHRRMRRGDIRTALLGALVDGPAHGYELITRLEEKSGGEWRPSPGSVYPTLQLFEDEGLVVAEELDGKRVYRLTEAGQVAATERSAQYGAAPWQSEGEGDNSGRALRKTVSQLLIAVRLVMGSDEAQVERALSVLRSASKELYQILSES